MIEKNIDKPTCPYCREETRKIFDPKSKKKVHPPSCSVNVSCPKCYAKWQIPGVTDEERKAFDHTKCAFCMKPGKQMRTAIKTVRIHDLLRTENGNHCLLVCARFAKGCHNTLSKFTLNQKKLFTIARDPDMMAKFARKPTRLDVAQNSPLTFGGFRICNENAVRRAVISGLKNGQVKRDCMLCFEETPESKMKSACGKCGYLACISCLKKWYNTIHPGDRFVRRKIQCPMCGQLPSWEHLRDIGSNLRRIQGLGKKTIEDFCNDPKFHYFWCRDCGQVKDYMQRSCAQGDTPPV